MRLGLPIVVLIVAFIFFRLLMRSVGKRSRYVLAEVPQAALAAGAAPQALPASAARGAALPAPSAEPSQSELERQVTGFVTTQPQQVADVVQAWIRED